MFSTLLRGLSRKGDFTRRLRSTSAAQSLLDSPSSFAEYTDDEEAGARNPPTTAQDNDDGLEDQDDDDADEAEPLLPIFSAAHLGALLLLLSST